MSYGVQNGKVIGCYYNTSFDFDGPASDPIPRFGTSSYTAEYTSRDGTNSPTIRGGITIVATRKMIRYRAVVSHEYIPTRRYHKKKLANGKWVRHYYIVMRKRKIWGYKTRLRIVKTRVKSPASTVLVPNRLSTTSYSVSNDNALNGSCTGRSGADKGTGTMIGKGIMQGLYCWPGITSFGVDVSQFRSVPSSALSWANTIDRGVLSKLYTNAQSNYANVANMLATAGQTTDMIASLLDSGISIARTIKKLDVKRAQSYFRKEFGEVRKFARQISDLWLQWTYGVAPLIDDVNKIAKKASSRKDVVRFRAVEHTVLRNSQSYTTGGSRIFIAQDCEVFVKHQVLMNTTVSIPKLAMQHGFGTPLATFWEVIPYSFILDWFYPLGDYLSSHKVFSSGVKSYHKSYLYKTSTKISSYPLYKGTGVTTFDWSAGEMTANIKHVQFVRTPLAYPPAMPTPRFSIGGFTQGRALNALALVLQRA